MTVTSRYPAGAAKTIVRRVLDDSTPDTLPNDIHPVLRRAYRARQVYSAQDLDRSADRLLAPSQLKGIEAAAALLAEALERRRRILVVADFDADGATS
ncbi:MAG TPA: single-stranded-DNA-specific exonuclease RecJ, partial [Burkholderiales bacterium]|nr:single-stranded-DNA-specific exonuclease RecJ [Burkholderiales bacterium]